MATDPRLELARRMIGSGRGASSGSPSSLQQMAAQQYAALSAKKKGASPAQAGPGGWKGIVSAALDNPAAKAILKPLSALDIGRAGVISGLKEISDAIDMNDATKASFGEFKSQVNNRIGFGDVIAEGGGTGNKWVDRVLGFAGDVAFDPLTYLTLGAGNLAGLAGRVNLAADIATQGARNVSAGRITQQALEELVQRAGTKGVGKLTSAERAAYGLPEAGLQFMGRRIAGTEKFAEKVGGALATGRFKITEAAPVRRVTRTGEGMLRRAPDNLEKAYTKLATGAGTMTAHQAGSLVASATEKAGKGAAFSGVWGRVAHGVLGKERDKVRNVQLITAIERGNLSDQSAAAAAKLLEDVRVAHAAATGKEIPKRANYFPHMWTRDGRRLLAGDTDVAKDLRKVLNLTVDEVNDLGFALERKIDAGTYKIAGKDVTFAEGTVEDINRTLAREFPEVVKKEVISSDLPFVVAQYIKAVGEDVGNAAFLNKMKALGVAVNQVDAVVNVVDTKATAEANLKAAKEFKRSLDGGKAAYDDALRNARTSTGEAVKHIGATLKLRLSTVMNRDKALVKQWEDLQARLIKGNVDFDAVMADLNAAEFDLVDRIEKARLLSEKLTRRYEDDIAAAGADEAALRKDRLVLRRQAKQQADDAQAKVRELEAHLEAYQDLKSQLDAAKKEIDSYEKLTTGDLPPEVRDVVKHRTVAEQRVIDESGRAGSQVVDQAIRVTGGQGEESFALSKRLRIDTEAASSVLRQTIDNAARYIDPEFAVELGRLRQLAQQVWRGGSEISEEAINRAEQQIDGLATKLRTEKAALAAKQARGASANSVSASERRIATLEMQIKNAYDSLTARIQSNIGDERITPADFAYDYMLPGTAAEQAARQLDASVRTARDGVKQAALAKGLPEQAAEAQADLFEKAYKAVEASVRYNKDKASSGAYIVAANDALEKATYKARINVDYYNRLNATINELGKTGTELTPAQARQIENLVMAEVLKSEKRAVQEQIGRLAGSLEHYHAKRGRVNSQALDQTKQMALAKQRVEEVYDWISGYIDEIKQVVDEGDSRVFNLGAREEGAADEFIADLAAGGKSYRTAEGAGVETRMDVFRRVSGDVRYAIALAITQNDKAARSLADSKNMAKLLSQIANGNPQNIKKAIEDELLRLISGTTTRAVRTEQQWYELSAQAAARQIDLLKGQEEDLARLIDGLQVSPAVRAGTPEAQQAVESYRRLLGGVKEEIRAAGRNITNEQRDRLRYYKELWETAMAGAKQGGIAPRAARVSPEDVLSGKRTIGYTAKEANKRLRETWTRMIELEGRIEQIYSTSPLKRAVDEVPGRKSPTTKAKTLVGVIDEEVAMLKGRLKTLKGADRRPVLEYIRTLTNQKEELNRALQQATPLDERLADAKVILDDMKRNVRSLTGKSEAEAEAAARAARLRAELDAVAKERPAAEARIAGRRAELEVQRAAAREQYDATVAAVRDGSATIEAARAEIEGMIPAIEQVMRDIPKTKGMRTEAEINAVYEWIVDAYNMIDPDGLVQRMANIPMDMTPEGLMPGGALGLGMPSREMAAFLRSMPNDPAARTALALIYKAQQDAGTLLALTTERQAEQAMYKLAKNKQLFTVLKQVAKDGLEEIASSGVYVPAEVRDAMRRVVSLDQRASIQLFDTMNYYTDLWKAVKTTSPRFHIRNAISATFMNYVAGVKTRNMRLGAQIYMEFDKNPLKWLDNIDPKYRPYAQDILDAVFASGGGQYGEIDNAATRLSERGVFRYSKTKGTTVEGSVRMGMALDFMLPKELGGRGMNYQQAVNAIEKYHFNYSKLSKMDRNARAFIPFWTFMSRNLPLQIEQMWLNPKVYAIYGSFVRNARDEQEGDVTPQWIEEIGGFKLPFGEGLYATPDIGMSRVSQDIEMLRDPIRFAQNLNPVFKTGLELMAGRQFYRDIPIRGDRYVELGGPRRVAQPLAALTGQLERGPGGEPLVSEKLNYALLQLVPGLVEAERLIAPSMENYKEKATQARVSFFTGLPATKVGPQQILQEQLRQKREADKKKAKERALRRATEG